ncbi:BQ5605_C009g05462 [Microbotryum silenes-dioicae]|uniref:BQ5605_C009g05462 protein n=1 Tax=Microbotryum silenes-dioicae TaxID=796604 RepID=A0A2X0MHV1_9BASI|nr:BQ5605_C009g05462 [Microbotryum silenes-dioicae]
MASLQDRLQAASEFLLQSPPGEVNDVFSDIRLLVSDDNALEASIVPTLSLYNRTNYVAITLENDPSTSFLLTEGGRIVSPSKDQEEERYVCPSSQTSYKVNHLRLTASDPRPFPIEHETQAIRDKVADLLAKFVKNHYHDAKSEVVVLEDGNFPAPLNEEEIEEPKLATVDDTKIDEEAKVDEEEGSETIEGKEATEGEVESSTTASASKEEDPAPVSPIQVDNEPTQAAALEEPTEQPTEPKPKVLHPRTSRIFALYFVGNKYNPSNYWTGRWRSVYTIDLAKRSVEAKAEINVHYYEQGPYLLTPSSLLQDTCTLLKLSLPAHLFYRKPGNVQLSTLLTSTLPLPTSNPSPESLIALLKSSETTFSSQLADAFESFSEEGFKGLRRALPKNKCKMDWEKVGHYKLGREMGGTTEV